MTLIHVSLLSEKHEDDVSDDFPRISDKKSNFRFDVCSFSFDISRILSDILLINPWSVSILE